jgi:hypothetical protein
LESKKSPNLLKTSVTQSALEFVNADDIAKGLSGFHSHGASSIGAGRGDTGGNEAFTVSSAWRSPSVLAASRLW